MRKPLNRQTVQVQPSFPERIVQFGGGNFLRAFMDWMIEELNDKADFNSSVVVVKATPGDSYQALDAQDGLFHVRLQGLQNGELVTQTKLIRCVSQTLSVYNDYDAFLALARQPEIRFIVSNTTEAGIVFEPGDQFDDTPPSSFPAKLTIFLYERFWHSQGGCIVLPCELIDRNGETLKHVILQYADLWELDTEFKLWVEKHNTFCNTLVDRIVPGFPQDDSVRDEIEYDDKLLVEGELYHSLVIEGQIQDEFPVHQTGLNVKIVDDLSPYRDLKVRILNGAHTAMVPVGYLLGLETVRQVMEHALVSRFVEDLVFQEILPILNVAENERTAFAQDTLNRFRNPFLQHRLLSIALNSIAKFRVRLLPTIDDNLAQTGKLPERLVFAFAALLRFYQGDWQGREIPLNDDPVTIARLRSGHDVILRDETLWGQDLTRLAGLLEKVSDYLSRIEKEGLASSLMRLNEQI